MRKSAMTIMINGNMIGGKGRTQIWGECRYKQNIESDKCFLWYCSLRCFYAILNLTNRANLLVVSENILAGSHGMDLCGFATIYYLNMTDQEI